MIDLLGAAAREFERLGAAAVVDDGGAKVPVCEGAGKIELAGSKDVVGTVKEEAVLGEEREGSWTGPQAATVRFRESQN